ncbi:alpha/beta hydrolase [Streptomyces sp. AM 2-1-1]|uniref:alpha/beta fold hydrolase n=1 Tax=unclassified Streptomyces TaxID=2593676 RepID=UPI0023BA388D|nr:alpha/beta hydrolase [Streptomyces sp. AM 2-1-1]WEH39157.1 alpha/beta hydrolase [Streptomyces sp. AM 2-1-1]
MTQTTVDDAIETGTVRVNDDVQLTYERRGSGPDVVLVNNFFMDRKSWRSYTANLASTARLTSYDLRGQGESSPQAGEPVWEDHITDLKALFDELGIEKAVLVGTSFSTLICRDFAVAYPERVHGLVLAGPAMSPHGGQRLRRITKAWLKTLDTSGLGVLYDTLYPLVSGDLAVEEAGPIGFMGRKQNFLGIHSVESLRAGLAVSVKAPLDPEIMTRVKQPTLLFVGGDDFSLSTSAVEEMTRLFPDTTTVTVPNGGHLAFLEEPEWFQREAVAFIERVAGPGD